MPLITVSGDEIKVDDFVALKDTSTELRILHVQEIRPYPGRGNEDLLFLFGELRWAHESGVTYAYLRYEAISRDSIYSALRLD